MLSPSDFIAQVSLRGMLHCKPEIVRAHPCSGDYTLIHHCNLNNDFIQKKNKITNSPPLFWKMLSRISDSVKLKYRGVPIYLF